MKAIQKIYRFLRKYEERIYFILLLCMALSFSFSRFYLRTFEIILVALFVLSGNYREKWFSLKKNKALMVLPSLFFLYLIGLIYAVDLGEGIKYLRVIMPWLGLPVIIGAYSGFSRKQLHLLLRVFVLGVLIHTLLSYLSYLGLPLWEVKNYRELNLFINTHRFVLTIVLSVIFTAYLTKSTWTSLSTIQKTGYLILLFWLVYFLVFSKILTGILVLLAITAGYGIFVLLSYRNIYVRLVSLLVLIVLTGFIGKRLYVIYNDFWGVPDVQTMDLPEKTEQGNSYAHDLNSKELENGYYVNLFVCEKELRKEWNERSDKDYNSSIGYYGKLSIVIKRYLTSRGLTKDSVGISKLTRGEIDAIENGVVNHKFQPLDFTDRLYLVAKEIHQYQIKEKPLGPFTARLYAMKLGFEMFKQKPLLGYGTHSLNTLFEEHYEQTEKEGRLFVPSHNQYLRYLIELGILGLLWFLIALFYPFLRVKGYRYFLFNGMMAYYLLASTMNNTFSAQLALTIFVTFYSVFFVYFNTASNKPAGLK